ncbi:unnamed protein product, partial [Rotaria sp. Silwood2]
VIVIIDEHDFLKLNPFSRRFLCWLSRREQYPLTFPNLYHFGDQEIFINSSFHFIFTFRQIDRMYVPLKSHIIDMSLSLNTIENHLWLRLVKLKCQSNLIQQVRSN